MSLSYEDWRAISASPTSFPPERLICRSLSSTRVAVGGCMRSRRNYLISEGHKFSSLGPLTSCPDGLNGPSKMTLPPDAVIFREATLMARADRMSAVQRV